MGKEALQRSAFPFSSTYHQLGQRKRGGLSRWKTRRSPTGGQMAEWPNGCEQANFSARIRASPPAQLFSLKDDVKLNVYRLPWLLQESKERMLVFVIIFFTK